MSRDFRYFRGEVLSDFRQTRDRTGDFTLLSSFVVSKYNTAKLVFSSKNSTNSVLENLVIPNLYYLAKRECF